MDNCPKCGAALFITHNPILVPDGKPDLQFGCNSMLRSGGSFEQTQGCRLTELTRTLAEVRAWQEKWDLGLVGSLCDEELTDILAIINKGTP